ncbi:MAG: YcaO-like family protein, partial [Polyangiaceae bacterium]
MEGTPPVPTPERNRARSPAETFARLQPLFPLVGITRVANVTGMDSIGIPVFMVVRPNARSLSVSQGKGLSEGAAKISGVMESVEQWHAERIHLPLRLARLDELATEGRVADVTLLPRFIHEYRSHIRLP